MFEYYIVINKVYFNKDIFPQFLTCAMTEEGFKVIKDLSEYLETGKGLGNDIVDDYISYIKYTNWEALKKGISKIMF